MPVSNIIRSVHLPEIHNVEISNIHLICSYTILHNETEKQVKRE